MMTTDGMRLTMTRTACKIAARKGWTAEEIQETFENPKAVYPSKTHDGQYRVAGREIVLVGIPLEDGARFHAITAIVNGSTAPVKE